GFYLCACRQLCFLSGAPGEREEDVIQGGPAQGQVVQGNLRGIEVAYDRSQELCPLRYRHDEVAALRVDLEFAYTVRAERLHSGLQVASLCHREFDPLATNLSF